MSNDLAMYLSKHMLWNALLISSPVILASLLCGLLVSIFQAATQIQDSTLSAAPKILVVVLMLMLCGEWMLHALVEFSKNIFIQIPNALAPSVMHSLVKKQVLTGLASTLLEAFQMSGFTSHEVFSLTRALR